MAKNLVKVVLDTNILISSIVFGGKPKQILQLVLDQNVIAITSPILLAELREVLSKKFYLIPPMIVTITIQEIEDNFIVVQPKKSLSVLHDEPDNRILEAALEG